MNTPTMTNRRYSPKPVEDYGLMQKVVKSIHEGQAEAWNLMFLVLEMEKPHPLEGKGKINIPAACWRTALSDTKTGEFLNPHIKTQKGRRIADLLQQPPSEFLAWAENSPIIDKLPLTKLMPNWVSVARSRLDKCGDHADTELVSLLDAPVNDTAQAAALLSKF